MLPSFCIELVITLACGNDRASLDGDDDESQVIGLMRAQPATEDDALAKVVLFTKYIELLPTALHSWESRGLQPVFDLLAGIQEVVAVNQAHHQNLFRWVRVIFSCLCAGGHHNPGGHLICGMGDREFVRWGRIPCKHVTKRYLTAGRRSASSRSSTC